MVEKKMKRIVRMPESGRRVVKRRVLPKELPELSELAPETIRETITEIQEAIREDYVFPEQVDDLCRTLEALHANNDYGQITDPATFCERVTQHLRNVVNDKHLQVMVPRDMPNMISHAMRKPSERSRVHPGLTKVEILQGNIGYISINMFNPLRDSADSLEGAMQFIKHTDALIIDLRKCRGGSGDSANFLLSYFFDSEAPVTLLETYFRPQNHTLQCQTTHTLSSTRTRSMHL